MRDGLLRGEMGDVSQSCLQLRTQRLLLALTTIEGKLELLNLFKSQLSFAIPLLFLVLSDALQSFLKIVDNAFVDGFQF